MRFQCFNTPDNTSYTMPVTTKLTKSMLNFLKMFKNLYQYTLGIKNKKNYLNKDNLTPEYAAL